ncbi:MAG: AmmeMemoRadiSam system protein B [Deltaproteobacteria bacterium]|nr:AmmeMemoRadiSam system protein B [Deltaproteobacteria bacterium]
MKIREPIFGQQGWYPSQEDSCRRAMADYLKDSSGSFHGQQAGIVPHAGWVFSGRLAAHTFAALKDAQPDLVFLFGGHMPANARPVCMPEGAFGSPLGPVEVDTETARELCAKFNCQLESPTDFNPDNTIELQIPFIKATWPEAKIVAVQVPASQTAIEIGKWAAKTASATSKPAVAIGSTDLTHYGVNYGFTPQGVGQEAHAWSKQENDRPFIDRLLAMDAQPAIEHALANHSACCPGAAAAAVAFAALRGSSSGQLIEHTTSYEVESRGQPTMWVGYAAIVF